jgi:hypothetical protein
MEEDAKKINAQRSISGKKSVNVGFNSQSSCVLFSSPSGQGQVSLDSGSSKGTLSRDLDLHS